MLTADSVAGWLPNPGGKAVCAVSGGLDSMCLLYLLRDWCAQNGAALSAAHFNHGLRPNADRDEAFVRDWCAQNGIPFSVGRGTVREYAAERGLSLEEAARTQRYDFLRREVSRRNGSCLYTAHHLNDNAETVLLNLVRGTGIRGLAGIRHCHDGIYRPFLDISRAELEEYAAFHGIPHVEDETNADPDAAARNLVRLRIMPLLRELNPKAEAHMHAAARRLAVIDDGLETEAQTRTAHMEARKGQVILPLQALREAPEAVRPRMFLCAVEKLGVGRKEFGAVHWEAVWSLTRNDSGPERRLDLPHGITARFRRGWLILEARQQKLTETELPPGQPLRWGKWILTLRDFPTGEGIAIRAPSESPCPVTVSRCVPGERLTLPGAAGSRSVKRLCVDRRISLSERDSLPAIYAGGSLAAVWGIGVDAAFVPDGNRVRFIQIEEQEETVI